MDTIENYAELLTKRIHYECTGFRFERYCALNIGTCQRTLDQDFAILVKLQGRHRLTHTPTGESMIETERLLRAVADGCLTSGRKMKVCPKTFRINYNHPVSTSNVTIVLRGVSAKAKLR